MTAPNEPSAPGTPADAHAPAAATPATNAAPPTHATPAPPTAEPDADDAPSVLAMIGEPFAALGGTLRIFVDYVGQLTRLSGRVWAAARKGPLPWPEIIEQAEAIGVRSAPIAMLILFFVGLVFAFQFGMTLKTMGAVPYVGKVTSLSIVLELGPVFTALVAGGRVGAGIAAEMGSMKVTEQIDAIRALGASPDKKLLLPRVIAATLMLPILVLLADICGIIGGMIISWAEFGVSPLAFYKSAVTTIRMTDFISGFLKPFFFGYGIALVGCHQGFTAGGGTVGVGKATTRTVVNISVMIVFVDFILTRVFALIPRI